MAAASIRPPMATPSPWSSGTSLTMRREANHGSRAAPRRHRPNGGKRLQDELELLRAENEQMLEGQRQLETERELHAGAYQATSVPCLVMDGQGMVRLVNA